MKIFLDILVLNERRKLPSLEQNSRTYIVEAIDQGGQAKVMKIKSKNKEYCFKYFLNTECIDETEREFIFLQKLEDCPYIVKSYGRKEIEGKYGIILEYCKGGNLRKYLRHNNLSSKIKLDIILQFALALEYLQNKKIIHSDLKCENILVVDESSDKIKIKLSDFGGALNYGKDKHFRCYTPEFAAPEMLLKKEPNLKSDIFSFASTCYYIFINKYPFIKKEDIIKCNLPNLSILKNKELQTLFEDCWKFDPNDRPSIEEIMNRIKKMYNKI